MSDKNQPKRLLVETYRPSTIGGYVIQDDDTKYKIEKWIAQGEIPHLLFTGPPGTGKSTLARVLINELGIQSCDVKKVNASLANGIGFIREELEPWMKKISFSKFKIVLLEEAERLTSAGQDALRDLTESYSDTVRFIMTANRPKQISAALHSRFQHISMKNINEKGIINLICDIVEAEEIQTTDEALMSHINQYAPDIRKIINSIDEHLSADKVLAPCSGGSSTADMNAWADYFASCKKVELSDVLALTESVDANTYEFFYETAYNNSSKFADEGNAVVLISQYLDRAQRCANQRLHLDAMLYHIFASSE